MNYNKNYSHHMCRRYSVNETMNFNSISTVENSAAHFSPRYRLINDKG